MKKIITKAFRELNNIYLRKRLEIKVKKADFEYGLNKEKRDEKIIVSLTTFPKRFDYLESCLKSITLQTVKPDKIIVYLGSDTSEDDIKIKLSKYEKYGIEFKLDKDNNYKSHKKYIYAFEKYSDSIIITLDDDLIYPNDLIESLLKKHKEYPNCIIARRVHKITWNQDQICQYKYWEKEYCYEKKPSHMLFATTGAGTLFPPNCLPKKILDYKLIKELCLNADDVWINFIAVLNGVKVVWSEDKLQLGSIIKGSQGNSLADNNVVFHLNDEYIKNVMKYFNITKRHFM